VKLHSLMQGALLLLALAGQQAGAACLATESEPNNSAKTANSGLCTGVAAAGSIGGTADEDWYKIEVAAAGAINISLAHDSGVDLDWYLYTGNGNGKAVAFASTTANPETGSYSASAAATYYVRVKSYAGATGRYTLTVNYPAAGAGGGGNTTACTLPKKVNLGKVGSSSWKTTATSGGILLMGGGLDVDNALKWMIARSGGGDFVVLRSSGTDAYNDYIYAMGGVNSVQTLLITNTTQANDACVVATIKNAGAVFLAGGDQADYVNYFKDQGVGSALNYLINSKHAPVGGTSAGMAVLGQFYHPGGADPATALQNPTAVAIGNNFINSAAMANLVTDTHFTQRARQPRLVAFLASGIYNYAAPWSSMGGIGADESTAVAVDASGLGQVYGSGDAWFVRGTGAPEILAPGTALTWKLSNQALRVIQVPGTVNGSNSFNLGTWTGSGGFTRYWYVTNGALTLN
jgi:cyanophycinase